jgi:hypothetical protein
VDRVAESEACAGLAPTTVAAPCPRAPAGPWRDAGPVALGRVSGLAAPLTRGASGLPGPGGRRAAGRGHAGLASARPSVRLSARPLVAAAVCRAVSAPRPGPWPPSAGRLVGPPARGPRGGAAHASPGPTRELPDARASGPGGAPPPLQAPRVRGRAAWAWRRGRRCGTMGGALASHPVVERRPARTAPAVAPWRPAQPRVESGGRNRRGSLRQSRAGPGCGAAGSGRKASHLPPSSSMAQTPGILARAETGGASALANPSQNAQSGTRDSVPTLVSGCAAGGGAPGSVTPSFLMLSTKRIPPVPHETTRYWLVLPKSAH